MKNRISKKIMAGMMLTVFAFSNTAVSVLATQDFVSQYANVNKPVLRDIEQVESSIKLKGEISITDKKSPVSISLRDSDVKQVLRMFADKAGLNIIFHNSVNGNVTLDLVDVPLNSAFEMVMEISELTYVMEDNTIIIASAKAEKFNMAKQEITLIPVKYVDASTLASFLNQNIYGIGKAGMAGTEVAITNPATNELLIFGSKNEVAIAKKVIDKFDRKPNTNVFKVNHTTPAQMAEMICSMLLPSAIGAGGSGGGGSSDSSSGSETGRAAGIMTGAADEVGGGGGGGNSGGDISLNGGVMACTYQSKVDAGSLSSLGLQNLAVAYYTQLGTVNVIGGSEQQVEMIKDFIAHTDKKQPQAYLEISIIELSESGSKTLDNVWQVWSKYFSASFSDGKTGTNNIYPTFFRGKGYDVVDPEDPSSILYSISKFTGAPVVTYAINYVIENKKGRVVANPRILITNGQESVIDLTSDYIKTVKKEVLATAGVAGGVQTTYEVADDNGIKVSITPFISPDGYVNLNITPDYATIKERVYGTGESGDTDLVATLLQRRNLELKNVRIKDGETLVIGGMISEDEQKTVKKIPVLGDIPGVGMFFRSTGTEKKKEEMVIMITPKIITDTEDSIGNREAL